MTAHALALVGLLLSAESAQAGPGQQQLANRWVAPRQRETTAWVLPSLFGGPVAGEKVCGGVYLRSALRFGRKQSAPCRVKEKGCLVCVDQRRICSDWRSAARHHTRDYLCAMT